MYDARIYKGHEGRLNLSWNNWQEAHWGFIRFSKETQKGAGLKVCYTEINRESMALLDTEVPWIKPSGLGISGRC